MMGQSNPLDPEQTFLDFDTDIKLPATKILYRIDEAKDILNVSRDLIIEYTQTGELEAVPINCHLDPPPLRRHIRITGRSIEAWINKRRKEV